MEGIAFCDGQAVGTAGIQLEGGMFQDLGGGLAEMSTGTI